MLITMRLLVTGGAGFIGSHIVELALAAGLDVAVLDDLSGGRRDSVPAGVPLFVTDLRDAQGVGEVIRTFRPEVISHQAAQVSVAWSVRDPLLDAEVNLIGGLNLLQAAVQAGVSRVVFASSGGAIYGEVPDDHAAHEHDPGRPISPYATSKLAFELYLETYRAQYGLESVVLRYGNVYGPRQNPHGEAGVVAIFAERLLRGEPLAVHASRTGDPAGCIRDYVAVQDVARANLAACLGRLVGPVNIGSGEGRTTAEVAEAVGRALGRPVTLQAAPYRPGDLQRSVLDIQRLRQAGLSVTPFALGLDHTADWFRTQATRAEAAPDAPRV